MYQLFIFFPVHEPAPAPPVIATLPSITKQQESLNLVKPPSAIINFHATQYLPSTQTKN